MGYSDGIDKLSDVCIYPAEKMRENFINNYMSTDVNLQDNRSENSNWVSWTKEREKLINHLKQINSAIHDNNDNDDNNHNNNNNNNHNNNNDNVNIDVQNIENNNNNNNRLPSIVYGIRDSSEEQQQQQQQQIGEEGTTNDALLLPPNIPHVIYQTCQSYDDAPKEIVELTNSWSKLNPTSERRVYDDGMVNEFVMGHYNETVYDAFVHMPLGI